MNNEEGSTRAGGDDGGHPRAAQIQP